MSYLRHLALVTSISGSRIPENSFTILRILAASSPCCLKPTCAFLPQSRHCAPETSPFTMGHRFSTGGGHVLLVCALLAAVSHAMNSCFSTDDYSAMRGEPFTITWPNDTSTTTWDLSLTTFDQVFVGYIGRESSGDINPHPRSNRLLAGNITQTSLIWTPPLYIGNGPFKLELWNWNRQSTCYSQNFSVFGSSTAQVTELPGPLATSAVTINGQVTTVTATVASFTPSSQTITSLAPSASAAASKTPASRTPKLQIGVGVAFGVLALIIALLLGLLWNSRRKAKARRDSVPEKLHNNDSMLKLNRLSHTEPEAAELGGRERLELSTAEMTNEIGPGRTRVELDAGVKENEPVEMPGDVPVGWGDVAKR